MNQKDQTKSTESRLIREAVRMRKKSYAPYSGFSVGAAVLCSDGSIYTGCNIENSSYPITICAERTAMAKAISEGHTSFTAIAVTGGKSKVPEGYSYPCGACRQFMREFSQPDALRVIVAKSEEDYVEKTLEELLPESFGPGNLV